MIPTHKKNSLYTILVVYTKPEEMVKQTNVLKPITRTKDII